MRFLYRMQDWLTPLQLLLLGFVILIFIGSILLTLPVASSEGVHTRFEDALFTATSAVTTTGLVVVDTGTHYSLFGQTVIMIFFQIGGLGYMIFVALIVLSLKGRLSLHTRMLLRESLVRQDSIDMVSFAKVVVKVTFFWEILGAVLLSLCWMRSMPFFQAVYTGIFHSVSAFCTAGFGLFSDSFSSYHGSLLLNAAVNLVCIAGGIGFFVLYDMYGLSARERQGETWHISVHTKFVLFVSAILIILGTGTLFVLENGGTSYGTGERLLNAAFQSISASTTTGFNTVDIGAMSTTGLFILILLMFVGASPGGTGGGIKTTTFGLMLLFLFSLLTGRENVNLFKRRISNETLVKVFAIGLIAVLWIIVATLVLTVTEHASFLQIIFEVVSAFGTVGLSMGITSSLTTIGKLIICVTMFIGRVGPLVIGFSLVGKPKPLPFKYPEADILVG